MKQALKWSALAVIALIVVAIGALLVIPQFLDPNRYKPQLERYVMETTGRPLTVGGDVRLSLFPWAGVSFSDLKLGNPATFVEKDFLTVKSFVVRVKLWPLLSKKVEVDRLVVEEPHLFLVTNKDGRVNWDFGAKPAPVKPSPDTEPASEAGWPIASLLVGELSLQNGLIAMIDHGKGSRLEVATLNAALRDVSFDRPVRLTISAAVNQKPLSAEGRFGPLGPNPGQGSVPLELTAAAFGQLQLKVKGTLENLMIAPIGRMDAEVAEFSPRRLLSEIGQPPPAAADPKVLERVSLKARVSADAKSVAVSDAVLVLDDSKLNFSAKATEFAKPNIAFDLHLDQINIDRYLPPPAASAGGPPASG